MAMARTTHSSSRGNASILTFPIQKVTRYTLFDAITDLLCVKGIPVPLPTSLLMHLQMLLPVKGMLNAINTTLLTTLLVKGMLNVKNTTLLMYLPVKTDGIRCAPLFRRKINVFQ
jgi:hypothetical protein